MEKAYVDEDKILKVMASLSFIFITAALILIRNHSPAVGYEISIYSALPSSVWILLILAIFCGISIVVYCSFKSKSFWIVGFFSLILVNFITLSLQFFRGYFVYGLSDPLGHLERTYSIVSAGFFGNNFYPVVHVLGAILVEVCNIVPETVIKIIPIIFTILFMLFTYLLASVVSYKREHAILAAAVGSVPLFSYYHLTVYPHGLSILTFPLLFYLYFKVLKTPSFSSKMALIVVLLLFPFFHPVIESILILCLVIVGLVIAGAKQIQIGQLHSFIEHTTMESALISIIAFFTWISYFAAFGISIQRISSWIGGEAPVIARATEVQHTLNRSIWQGIELLFKMYGHNIVFFACSLIALILIVKRILQRQAEIINFLIFSVIFIVCTLAYFFVSMALGLITWGRFLGANIGTFAIPVFASFALYQIRNPKRFKLGVLMVVLILTMSSAVGIFSIYRSPWIYQTNWQITRMDISGSSWLNIHSVEGFDYEPMGWQGVYRDPYIPEHFGNPEYVSVGMFVKENTYLVITERFKQVSLNSALKGWINMPWYFARPGFDKGDFARVRMDPSANELYSNGEFEVLLIVPLRGSKI